MFSHNFDCLLTVRVGSSRLPRKCLLPFGKSNLLSHVVNRSVNSGLRPVVCTSAEKSDDPIEDFCNENGVEYFRGSLGNKLRRWSDCATKFGLEDFHTIDVDDPFFSPDQVKESLVLLRQENLDLVAPTALSAAGSASVGYSINSSFLSGILAEIPEDIEMVDTIFSNFDKAKSRILESRITDREGLRLTLDYPEDYWLLSFLERTFGTDAKRDQIFSLFDENPDLYKMNWFRNEEWAARQNEIRKQTNIE